MIKQSLNTTVSENTSHTQSDSKILVTINSSVSLYCSAICTLKCLFVFFPSENFVLMLIFNNVIFIVWRN